MKWVGSYPSLQEYNDAATVRLAELEEEVDSGKRKEVPTVIEFAEAKIKDDGRIEIKWPDGQRAQKEEGRRESSVKRMRDGLRPFLREFAERRLDSFSRDEALTWAHGRGANTRQAVGQFFGHAVERELIPTNHFRRLGGSKRKRRVDRPDFEILSDEQYERLLRCARASREDDFGLIIEGAILAVGEAALRPGEVFALHRDEIDYEKGEVAIRWNLNAATGKREWPKDDEPRWVPLSPRLLNHLPKMPVLSKILFPAPRGGYMSSANWSKHWHSARSSGWSTQLRMAGWAWTPQPRRSSSAMTTAATSSPRPTRS
jgi:integrase